MTEARANPRRVCDFPTEVTLLASEDTIWAGIVRDVSEGGIGLLSPRGFPAGTILVVRLTELTLAVVVHLRQVDNRWFVGCKFLRGGDR